MEKNTELQLNAIAAERRRELGTYQRALDMQWMNNRMEDGRMGRCLALIQREAEMEKNYQEKTDHAAIVNSRVAKETALAFEVAKLDREERVKYLRSHYLRQRDPELKELSKKVLAGYVCRDLQQQIRNNEYKRLQEKAEAKQANVKLREAMYSDQEYQEVEERARAERTAKYGQELRQQLVSRQIQKQCQYEDTLIEKKMLDEIMRTISDEDKREMQQKREQREKLRQEMVTFKMARDAWGRKQREMVLLEEKEIEKQQQAISNRDAAIIAERERRQKLKEETNQKIAARVMASEYARQERDHLINLLQEQEYLEANIQNDVKEREKLERVKKETKEALTQQMIIKKQQQQQEIDISANYLKQMREKMAQDDEKEKEKQRLIKEKNKKHCAELLKQAEEQRRIKLEGAKDDQMRAKAIFDHEKSWREEVAKERANMIKEHVPGLLGYLQAGIIKEADLPLVKEGAEMKPELKDLKVENLAHVKRPKRFSKCNDQCRILRQY